MLADARQVKNLPGRPKRDPSDSAWLAACFERGAVTACFVAAPEFRLIRLHTRYRRDLTEERTREKNRAEKLLESAAIKVSSVLTDLHGVTGRDIMGRLIAGERDPKVLAQLARGRARAKISQLAAALEGAEFFAAEHAALLKTMLDRIDRIDAEITRLSQTIERLLAPWEEQLQQAESMPGWRRRSAEDALAETGPDMTRFPAGAHLASGPAAPRWTTPPASARGRPNRRGNRYLAAVTGETSVAAEDRHPRRRPLPAAGPPPRQGQSPGRPRQHPDEGLPRPAIPPGTRYQDLGPDYYERQRDTRRQIAHHVGKLGALGFEVTLARIPGPNQTQKQAPAPPDETAPAQVLSRLARSAGKLPRARLRFLFRVSHPRA